jgi:hypothetical protein
MHNFPGAQSLFQTIAEVSVDTSQTLELAPFQPIADNYYE